MASEWVETTLGSVVDFVSGGTPSKKRTDFWDGSVPWVSAKDMKSLRLEDTQDHLTKAGLANGTKLIPTGTVLLLARGMTLHNDVPICIVKRPMAFNQDLKAILPGSEVRADFLPYLLLGNKVRLLSLVDMAGHGTGRLNSDELKALAILLPPEVEQRAIAHILSTLDDKIELNRGMNETLEAMARALFKSWFVDFDPVRARVEGRDTGLPQHIGELFPDSFEKSEVRLIPQGWHLRPLDAIARFRNGLALQRYRPEEAEGRLPVVKIAQLRSGLADSGEWASAGITPECIIDDGDIVFSWSGSLLVRVWCGGRAALNQHLFKVTSDTHPKWFYHQCILSHLPAFQHIASGKATTMGHIKRQHLTEALCAVPGEDLLVAAGETFGALLDRWIANEVQSRTLASLRDTLLPKLISGEIRVKGYVDRLAREAGPQ